MRLEKCPRCSAAVHKTDHVCVSCGLDLLEAEKKLSAQAAADAARVDRQRAQVGRSGAAAGVATDVGEDTRLRVYDQFHVEAMKKEKQTAIATTALGAIIGTVFVFAGLSYMGKAGGLNGLINSLSPSHLRDLGFGMVGDNGVLAAVMLGLGIAGLLMGIGQFQRVLLINAAVADVKFGGRPTVVSVPAATAAGMLIASFLFPPLGIILGILFMLSHDSDTHDLGGKMLLAGGIAIALCVGNVVWGLAGQLGQGSNVPVTPGG
jgi:hypothetical protein